MFGLGEIHCAGIFLKLYKHHLIGATSPDFKEMPFLLGAEILLQ